MELYSYDACPFAQRTRMVLAEKGLPFDLHEIDVHNKPDGWEKISPYGKVPLLRDQGGTIYESAIINEYLDETYPEPPLMPATKLARAQARIWIDYCDSRFLPALHKLVWSGNDADARGTHLETVTGMLHFIESEGLAKCGPGPFWFGDWPSLVDFHYLPFFERFAAYDELVGLRIPADCPRLAAWLDAMCARDSVNGTLRPADYHIAQQRRMMAAVRERRAAAS
ncbi:MAG: glutathione S-transferase family protein [Gammaproteobacteria bacterium]|nr:glutathione S-transferase family protein [Gammaproteobacteria bacterium]